MATTQGSIQVHQDDAALTFRVIGRATMQQAPVFLREAQGAIAQNLAAVRVDLRDCAYMDSTFLGSLLTLRRAAARGPTRFELVAPSDAALRLLEQMGLAAFLTVADPSVVMPQGPWHDLEEAGGDRAKAVQETVVKAHQELADTPSPGCEQFKSIASKLAEAWAKQKKG